MPLISARLQLSALVFSLAYLAFLVHLVRREILQLKYSLFWFVLAGAFLVLAIHPPVVLRLKALMGVKWPENAVYILAIFSILVLLMQVSAGLSRSLERERLLAQELALLRHELESLKEKR